MVHFKTSCQLFYNAFEYECIICHCEKIFLFKHVCGNVHNKNIINYYTEKIILEQFLQVFFIWVCFHHDCSTFVWYSFYLASLQNKLYQSYKEHSLYMGDREWALLKHWGHVRGERSQSQQKDRGNGKDDPFCHKL